jgi:ABC-type branched-subunit amino acid transport system ATPase component
LHGAATGWFKRPALDVTQYLEIVGLTHLSARLARALSGGERRRLELGRVLAARRPVLLLDEPVAGLRVDDRRTLTALLQRIAADGAAIVLVEHDLAFVRGVTDRVCVMHSGEVLAEGPIDDVVRNEHVRRAYLGAEGRGGA